MDVSHPWQIKDALTKASFVIEIWICEMKVLVHFVVVELDRHSVMVALVYRPGATGEVQTCKVALAWPNVVSRCRLSLT